MGWVVQPVTIHVFNCEASGEGRNIHTVQRSRRQAIGCLLGELMVCTARFRKHANNNPHVINVPAWLSAAVLKKGLLSSCARLRSWSASSGELIDTNPGFLPGTAGKLWLRKLYFCCAAMSSISLGDKASCKPPGNPPASSPQNCVRCLCNSCAQQKHAHKCPYLREWYKAVALNVHGLWLDSVLPCALRELSQQGKAFKVAANDIIDHRYCKLQAGR